MVAPLIAQAKVTLERPLPLHTACVTMGGGHATLAGFCLWHLASHRITHWGRDKWQTALHLRDGGALCGGQLTLGKGAHLAACVAKVRGAVIILRVSRWQ